MILSGEIRAWQFLLYDIVKGEKPCADLDWEQETTICLHKQDLKMPLFKKLQSRLPKKAVVSA